MALDGTHKRCDCGLVDKLEAYGQAVRLEERERCARTAIDVVTCEAFNTPGYRHCAESIARAIRGEGA